MACLSVNRLYMCKSSKINLPWRRDAQTHWLQFTDSGQAYEVRQIQQIRKKTEGMKIRLGAVLIAAAILAGCGGGDDGGASATPTFTIGG